MAEPIEMPSGGRLMSAEITMNYMGDQIPHGKGSFEGTFAGPS